MNLTDLFGEGATHSGGILSIPLSNIYAIGFSPTNTDKISLVAAILLLPQQYFQGSLVDGDGAILVDFDDAETSYDQNRLESSINYQFVDKKLTENETLLVWKYSIKFYTEAND